MFSHILFCVITMAYVISDVQAYNKTVEDMKKYGGAASELAHKKAMKYYGAFMNSMQNDLWLSVALTFTLVFLGCFALYTLARTVETVFYCLTCQCCFRKKRRR